MSSWGEFCRHPGLPGARKVQFKGSDTEKLGKIITEKYLNFFMQGGNEAYFELRRTGYPDFSAYLTHNTDQIYNDGYLPLRYRYPQSEIDNNNAQVSRRSSVWTRATTAIHGCGCCRVPIRSSTPLRSVSI